MYEHMDIFGLINMNGRVYDPWVGRMLSPDPFIQDPTNLQNYNRYSYALNNPLKYVDPSGYLHGSKFKPGDWNAGMGSGGALYINTSFTNDFNENPFGSYEQRHTYSYDNSTGKWSDGVGQQVSPLEVYANKTWSHEEFNNFVEENSMSVTDYVFTGTADNPYQEFRGLFLNDGSSWYLGNDMKFHASISASQPGIGSDDQNGGGVPDFISNTLQIGIPDAFSLEGTGSAESSGASSMSPIRGILIIKGPDAFNAKGFSSAGLGGGWVSASAMAVGYVYYYFGDINNFSMKTFEGWGNNINISGDIGFAAGINVSWVENPNANGEYLIGVGFGGGVGISPTVLSGQYTRQFNHIFW